MLALLPLLSVVLAVTPGAGTPQAPPSCESASAAVELRAERSAPPPVLCISPELVTTLVFATPLSPGAVAVQATEQEMQVVQGPRLVTLLPAASMLPGEWRKVTVRFDDGAAPASATLLLYVHPKRAVRQVEVRRQVRTVESYQRELEERTQEAQRCQEENVQLRATAGKPAGLRDVLSAGLMNKDGIASAELLKPKRITVRKGSALALFEVYSYRSHSRVAVELILRLPAGAQPWVAEGAKLVDAQGQELPVLPLWQEEAPEDGKPRLMVEAAAAPKEARGPFTLKLWAAGGQRGLTVEGVVFPHLPGTSSP